MEIVKHELNGFILNFLHAAPGRTASSPTLLLLHGTGGDENSLLDLGRMLAPGLAILSPRGKVLENGMPRFFRRLAEGVFDLPDLKLRTHELADLIAAASVAYKFDPAQVIAVGYSNGANIAASMLLDYPGVLSASLLFHPMVPFVPQTLPDLSKTPVFISAGRHDPIVLASETERLVALLQQSGAEVAAHWYSGGHEVSHAEVRDAKAWLQTLLTPFQATS